MRSCYDSDMKHQPIICHETVAALDRCIAAQKVRTSEFSFGRGFFHREAASGFSTASKAAKEMALANIGLTVFVFKGKGPAVKAFCFNENRKPTWCDWSAGR